MSLRWLAIASLAGLCACGGGGGGGSNGGTGTGSGSSGGSWLTFSPASVDVTTYAGETAKATLTARWTKTVNERLNVAVVENAGVIDARIDLVSTSDAQGNPLKYDATIRVSPKLAAGTYTGHLEVRLCLDDAAVCSKPYDGSPWRIPYHFTVKAGSDLKPLVALAGLDSWGMYQGNASHNGYIGAEVNPEHFTRRFGTSAGSLGGYESGGTGVAVENGRVILAHRSEVGASWDLRAISEATGQILWNTALGRYSWVNPPAVAGGKVYLTSSSDSYFLTFNDASGQKLAQDWISSGRESLGPTVHQGKIYATGRNGATVHRYDAATSAFEWYSFETGSNIHAHYVRTTTPVVDEQYVYMCGDRGLYLLDLKTGAVRSNIAGFDMGHIDCHVSRDSAGSVLLTRRATDSRGALERYDTDRKTVAWQLLDKFQSAPVIANGVVYVNNGARFEARTLATGALLWDWTAPGPTTKDLLVIGSHALVGTSEGLHAVDLRSRKSVWSYPTSGALAVSPAGVLYIRHADGLVAINLH